MSMEYQLRNHRMFFAQQQLAMRDRSGDKSIAWSFSPRHSLPSHVSVKLQNQNLWREFHAETTEMIITKNGRRMFPSIQLTVSGLEKHERYYILLEILPACTRRYKYCGNGASGQDENGNNKSSVGGWSFAGPGEPQPRFDRRIYMHPDGPATGDYWMQNTVSFNKLKLTNNVVDQRNNVLLTSMHKYIPIIHIIHCNNAKTLTELFAHPAASFSFNETAFIAVTAYQNENITKLKINNNPFAKGFRETGQSRCKRKYQANRDRNMDDDKNSSFESESNPSASSLDNLMQERRSESGISDDDACDTAKRSTSITDAGRGSPLREENNRGEMSTRFHRPWLDSPASSSRPIGATAPSSLQMVSLYPSYLAPNFSPMFVQQPDFRLQTYYYSMLKSL